SAENRDFQFSGTDASKGPLRRRGRPGRFFIVVVLQKLRSCTTMGAVHQRRGRAPKTPTLLAALGVRGRLNIKITNALSRACWTRAYELQRHRHVSSGVAPCQSEILSLKKVVWRQWLVSKSRTKSSVEGCEQLLRRAASVARPSSSPSHARSV